MPFTSASSASFTPNLHHRHTNRWSRTILKKKEFSLCPLLPPLALFRPLLAQTSTTPHTKAHHHRGHRSCAWSLETYQSHHESRSKGFFFHDFPFSPIWISNWVFGFFVCFIRKFQILSISFLMRTEGECMFISCIVLMKDAVLSFDMIWALFGFWIRDVWLIWLS